MLTETAPKHGHRIIWVPFLDPRGRTFHQRTEDNGGIPGVYVGVEPAEGTWVAVKITGHDVAERPVWSSGERERWNASLNRPGQPERTVLTAFGVRWSYIELAACLERHAATTACDGCGSRMVDCGNVIDARTADERVLCMSCRMTLERRLDAEVPTYTEMQCACGAYCYVQETPTPTARGRWHDVQACPKCKALRCAECLPDGQAKCQGCLTKTKRRVA